MCLCPGHPLELLLQAERTCQSLKSEIVNTVGACLCSAAVGPVSTSF